MYERRRRTGLSTGLLVLLCSGLHAEARAAAVRIMPLGDSITYDENSGDARPAGLRTAYRQSLYLQLTQSGLAVDFVGSRVAGQDAVPSFDPDNEGWSGVTDTWIADRVYGFLDANPADMVLLHIGTNALNPSPGDVEDILDEIDRYEADNSAAVKVVLARIVDRAPRNPTTTLFNDNVQTMAQARIVTGDDIVMVDMEDGAGLVYTVGSDMADLLHPNTRGYSKMADAWANAVHAVLDGALPTTWISNPSEDLFLVPRTEVVIVAYVATHGADVTRVDFLVDDVKVGEATSIPYTCTWSTSSLGRYSITAFAVKDDVVFGPLAAAVSVTTVYPPFVSVTAVDAYAAENPVDEGRFALTCDRAPEVELTVSIAVSGGAEDGVDYNVGSPLGTSVTIPLAVSEVTVDVVPFDDDVADEYESVTVTILEGSGYRVGTQASATIPIEDDDLSPAPFDLVAPGRSARNAALTPRFEWNASDQVTGYTLAVADDAGLADPLFREDLGDVTAHVLDAAFILDAGQSYYWSVTAVNLKGLTRVARSAPYAFTTSEEADQDDLDGDGLPNADELAADPYETDPLLWDTDGDGCPDDWEILHRLDPTAASDGDDDRDGDRFRNWEEYLNGTDPWTNDLGGLGAGKGCLPGGVASPAGAAIAWALAGLVAVSRRSHACTRHRTQRPGR